MTFSLYRRNYLIEIYLKIYILIARLSNLIKRIVSYILSVKLRIMNSQLIITYSYLLKNNYILS